MLTDFFLKLRAGGVPASVKEYLVLLEALKKHVSSGTLDEFYYLARACLVKDESNYDKFDRVFGAYFKGIASLPESVTVEIPEEWLRRQAELLLTE
ncbi:MAG: VWA domain-containing protein, partial [Betaproteobacteria bacterium]